MNNHSEQSGHSGSANSRKSRLLVVGLWSYAVVVLALGWSFAIRQIRSDRELTLQSSNAQLIMTSTALAKHVEAMINDGVGAAAAGVNEMTTSDQHALTSSQMATVLARMLTGGNYVNTLFVATPTLFVTAQRNAPLNTMARQAWVNDLLMSKRDTWVGKPLNAEQGDSQVLIPIARKVTDLRGETTWVGALFSVTPLDTMYRALPAEHSSVSLISEDAVMLIRIPISSQRNFAGFDISHVEAHQRYIASPKQPLVTLEAADPFSGKPRQYAARRVEDYPIVAVAGRNVEDSLIAWRARTVASVWMFSIASMVLTALTIALYVILQRRFQAITRSEQRFQLAVQGTNDGIWEWEMDKDYVYHSLRFKELLGYREGDEFPAKTSSFWERVHPEDLRATDLALQRHLLHRDPYDVEFRLRTRTGEHRWFRARAQALWNEQGDAFRIAGSISDITDRKLAEQALKTAQHAELHAKEEFAQQLLLAQEQERLRLANELHDSVGQNLSLIKNRALMMLHQSELPASVAKHAAAVEQLTAEVIAEVRSVAQNLRPMHIEELGLTSAVDSLLDKVGESGALKVEKHIENVDDVVSGEAATHIYRIVQEAINNIIKHAQARSFRIKLERDIHCVRLVVVDDGVGFDVKATGSRGLGLASLSERCRMLSATLKLESTAGVGTTLYVEYPCAETATNPIKSSLSETL